MLHYIFTIVNQIFIMFLLMLVGYILSKKNILTEEGTKQISTLLMMIVTPAVIIASYQREFEYKLAKMLLISFALGLIAYAVPIIIGSVLFKTDKTIDFQDKRMCLVFSNNGFMAIPLLQALLGSIGVFLGSAHIVLGNVFLWTYGAKTMGREKYQINLKTALINPGTLAMLGGLLVFISPVKLPNTLYQVFNYIGAINMPLAMMVLGAFLAKTDFISCFTDKSIYTISIYKLVLVPAVLMGVLHSISADQIVTATLLIGAAAPTGIVAPMFAQRFNTKYLYSTKVVTVTTLLCIMTMPVFLTIIEFFWK
ncbi:AEC family transporter [Cellulosilyticum sp. I15G10I2]|uniref:AEC family transporter n=1 Tax=Cellulosilyticum sp. I15G10I2 TaxID=1892843 RepID=UPI00085C1AAC|nr:AEC family transporter [Cellulosilyticum sp. I15G10I2]